jgi:S1-C subfamily serine protease
MQDAEDTTIPPRSGREISKISQGTCFFVSGNGEVVTNYHVVEDSSVFEVIDSKGTKFTATLTAKDPANDLAVLQVSSLNHRYLSIAPFGSLKTGQYIFAVGYPASSILGTEVKFTDGVVSSMTGIQNTANTFQMTVPIQPGNSGGPVLNEKGQVVGVATSTAAIEAFLRGTGSLPQNVNWAVKSEYLALLTGIKPSDASQGSREEAIHAAINASCMVKAQ